MNNAWMGGHWFIKLVDKIGKIPGFIVFAGMFFFVLWGMFFYVGWRVSVVFHIDYTHWYLISLLIAVAGVIMNNCNFSKKKLIHCISLLFLWAFMILAVATVVFAIEQGLHLSFWTSGAWLGVVLIGVICAILLVGYLQHKKIIRTVVTIQSEKIKEHHKAVFISDLHANAFHGKRFLKNLVGRILLEKPDFVLVGGDLVNFPQPNYVAFFQAFQRLKMPVYAIIGNHDVDFDGDTSLIDRVFKVGRMIPLRNQSVKLFEDIQLVGIDDEDLRGNKRLKGILAETQMQDEGRFTILLSHRPYRLSKLSHTPVDLELAGHTHAGQIWVGIQFSQYLYDYVYGLASWKDKKAFTSQGVGSLAPIRLGTEGEIVVLHLQAK